MVTANLSEPLRMFFIAFETAGQIVPYIDARGPLYRADANVSDIKSR